MALARECPLQTRLAGAQHAGVELSLGRRRCGTAKDAIELRPVEGDQQQIDAGIERLMGRRAAKRPKRETPAVSDIFMAGPSEAAMLNGVGRPASQVTFACANSSFSRY